MSASHRTYPAVLPAQSAEIDSILSVYAHDFCKAVRTSYSRQERAIRLGTALTKMEQKSAVMSEFGFTARQANAVLAESDGKRVAQTELLKVRRQDTKTLLQGKTRKLKAEQEKLGRHRDGRQFRMKPEGVAKCLFRIHLLKTSIQRLGARLRRIQHQLDTGTTYLTFGSKKLLRSRRDAADLTAWRAEWKAARNNQFLVLGSKDETGGCQGCVASEQPNGLFTLRLRLPGAESNYLTLTDVRVPYGAERLRYALAQQASRAEAIRTARKSAKDQDTKFLQRSVDAGAAITWRFMRQSNSQWVALFSTEVEVPLVTTSKLVGAIGVDVNVDFITVANVDRTGNVRHAWNIQTPSVGLTSEQREARAAEAVKQVIGLCVREGKPLALEDLDLTQKKRAIGALGLMARRKLSALAYADLKRLFLARACDAGVDVITVTPAYTSTQGLINYGLPRKWTAHQGAAGVIARRALGFAEKAPVCGTYQVPLATASLEWTIPVEIVRCKRSLRWPKLHSELRQTIASYFRKQAKASRESRNTDSFGASEVAGEIPALKRTRRAPELRN